MEIRYPHLTGCYVLQLKIEEEQEEKKAERWIFFFIRVI